MRTPLVRSSRTNEFRVFEQGGESDLAYLGVVRQQVHGRCQHFLEDAAQAARTDLVLHGQVGDLLEHGWFDEEFHAIVVQHLAVLFVDRVLRFGHDPDHHLARKRGEVGNDRQASGEFRDQAEFGEVGRLDALVEPVEQFLVVVFGGRNETEGAGPGTALVKPDEGAAADEQDLGGVDVLLAIDLDRGAFHDLQQCVLDPLARGAAHLALLAVDGLELVDFVDENDAALGASDVAFGFVDEPQQDGLDFVIDVFALGQRGGVRGDEGHLQDPGERLADQGLAGAGGTDQEHVALDDLRFVRFGQRDLFVMGVNGDGKLALGIFLTDDMLAEGSDDLARGHDGQRCRWAETGQAQDYQQGPRFC